MDAVNGHPYSTRSVSHLFGFIVGLGRQPPALARSSDISTLGGGVTFG